MMTSGPATMLLALLFSFLALLTQQQQQYSLSPPLPPTAFVDQYYSCAFRVGGLSKPRFSFSRLPPPLVGSKSGIVWGVPSASGAYRATVTFWQEEEQDNESTQEVMFIVTLPQYNTAQIRSRNITQPVPWVPGYLQTVYQYGGVIDLNLAKVAGKNQYNWTYLHLPYQLHGDVSGRINGVINQTGYFTFAAICADQQGNTLDYFITLNIQPLSYDKGMGYKVQVQNLFPYDLLVVDAVHRDATENAELKMREYRNASEQLDRARRTVQACRDNEKKAKTQAEVVGQIVKIATKQLAKQLQIQNWAGNRLKHAKGVSQLKKVAYFQAEINTKSAQLLFDSANSAFLYSKKVLSQTSSLFITAQTQSSQASSLLSSAQLSQQLALQDVNSTFQSVMEAKQLLQNYTVPASILDLNVSSARSEREVASFQNDAAMASLNSADSYAKKMLQQLQATKNEVYILKEQLSSAKGSLGQAQFNLTQARNNLFLAQAAKEQSDKQLLLASAQSVQLASLTFAGCNQGNYPSMFGTATILVAGNSTFKLDSGYNVLMGGCTNKGKGDYTNGTVLAFEGYLKGGAIHAIRLSNG